MFGMVSTVSIYMIIKQMVLSMAKTDCVIQLLEAEFAYLQDITLKKIMAR